MNNHEPTQIRMNARESRDAYAALLRQFASGRMTNVKYERQYDRLVAAADSADPAVDSIYCAVSHFYCDLPEHRLTSPKHRLPREGRRLIAKWVLFLYSDLDHTPEELSARHWLYLMSRVILTIIAVLSLCGGTVGLVAEQITFAAAGWLFAVFALAYGILLSWGSTPYPDVGEAFVAGLDAEAPWPFPTVESCRAVLQSPKYLIGASHPTLWVSRSDRSRDPYHAD